MVDVLTIVISTLAVIVSVTTLILQNFTSRKQYEPILDIILGDYIEDKYIKIENNGCGPATICKCEFTVEKTSKDSPKKAFNAYLQKISKKPVPDNTWDTFVDNIVDRTIGAEREKMIIYLKSNDKELNALFLEVFSKMIIKIQYKDIYGRKKTVEKACSFFSRNDINNKDVK